jgi:hypothetical protein
MGHFLSVCLLTSYTHSNICNAWKHYSVCSNEARSNVYDKCSNIKLIHLYLINLSAVWSQKIVEVCYVFGTWLPLQQLRYLYNKWTSGPVRHWEPHRMHLKNTWLQPTSKLENTFLLFLTFMEPCIASCVFYITNEMQLIQCSLLLSALYMFRAVFPPIIRSL